MALNMPLRGNETPLYTLRELLICKDIEQVVDEALQVAEGQVLLQPRLEGKHLREERPGKGQAHLQIVFLWFWKEAQVAERALGRHEVQIASEDRYFNGIRRRGLFLRCCLHMGAQAKACDKRKGRCTMTAEM